MKPCERWEIVNGVELHSKRLTMMTIQTEENWNKQHRKINKSDCFDDHPKSLAAISSYECYCFNSLRVQLFVYWLIRKIFTWHGRIQSNRSISNNNNITEKSLYWPISEQTISIEKMLELMFKRLVGLLHYCLYLCSNLYKQT